MGGLVFNCYDGHDVTDAMLEAAAELFNNNYGIWDEGLGRKGRVKLSARRLRENYLPQGATTVYASVTSDGTLVGNAFACRWRCGDKTVCWVTQLVVARGFRERGLANSLLRLMRQDTDSVYGIMSSHPAAILASAKAFGRKFSINLPRREEGAPMLIHFDQGTFAPLDLNFMRTQAAAVMVESPISYVKDAKLSGSLFLDDTSGLVAGVDTRFFLDHTEPSEALERRRKHGWALGALPAGHEFILVLQV
ncbi:hypothetical protein RB594_002754 [Gaeumannomyces avenae]